jgi:hypothetical protein
MLFVWEFGVYTWNRYATKQYRQPFHFWWISSVLISHLLKVQHSYFRKHQFWCVSVCWGAYWKWGQSISRQDCPNWGDRNLASNYRRREWYQEVTLWFLETMTTSCQSQFPGFVKLKCELCTLEKNDHAHALVPMIPKRMTQETGWYLSPFWSYTG